jgi:RNA polymerase sigma-70 factor (ECF subfamily)
MKAMVSKVGHLDSVSQSEHGVDWEKLFHEEFPRIYNYLRYRTANDAVAEELAAETFARAWRSREQYRQDLSAFSTWLFTIARNLAIDHLRQRQPQIALEDIPELEDEQRVHDLVQRRDNAEHLAILLARLPRREAEIIALRYGADMSYRQIARVLQLSPVNVRVILFRTVRKLRAQWQAEWE